jgi:hypothetical protein
VTYLCAGLYAEGRTDYALLLPLLDQMIPVIAAEVLREVPTIAPSVGIDASSRTSRRREVRLAAAIREHWDQCTLFVVHADGAGDPERALREQVEPGLALARSDHGALAAAACVPVREIEAWMLADPEPFGKLQIPLALPGDPETVPDPKRVFREIVARGSGGRLDSRLLYEFFGNNVSPPALRKLPAFCRFEAQLAEAITRAARP